MDVSRLRLNGPLVTALCAERGGPVWREVYRLKVGKESIDFIFERLKGLPSMFSNQPLEDRAQLVEMLDGDRYYYLVDDVGLIGIELDFRDNQAAAHVHVTFWDRKLRGREAICREMCLWVMGTYGLDYLWTAIPTSFKAVREFARRVGFRYYDYHIGVTTDRQGARDDAAVMVFTD